MSLTISQMALRLASQIDSKATGPRQSGTPATGDAAISVRDSPRDAIDLSAKTLSTAKDDIETSKPEDARIEALSREKGRAREALERIREEIKLMRKMWQFQPREMAKQIARLAKELKEVLDDYKKVQKALADLQGGAVGAGAAMPSISGAGLPIATSAPAETGETATDSDDPAASNQDVQREEMHKDTDIDGEVDDVSQTPEVPDHTRLQAVTQYERVRLDQTPAAMELRGDLEFAGFVKGLTGELRDAFRDVKRWAIGFKQDDKESEKLYEATEKGLKQLEKELGQFEDDIRRAMPPSIWVSQPVVA